jgi:hypothetical protein
MNKKSIKQPNKKVSPLLKPTKVSLQGGVNQYDFDNQMSPKSDSVQRLGSKQTFQPPGSN